ncbi:hypothetical protein ACFX13_013467 [Malus domestica]
METPTFHQQSIHCEVLPKSCPSHAQSLDSSKQGRSYLPYGCIGDHIFLVAILGQPPPPSSTKGLSNFIAAFLLLRAGEIDDNVAESILEESFPD